MHCRNLISKRSITSAKHSKQVLWFETTVSFCWKFTIMSFIILSFFVFYISVKRHSPNESDVDLESNEQKTPLHLACLHGHVETVRTLLEYNANPNYKCLNQITPLHLAAIYGRIDIIKILVKYGGKLNNRDSFHMTPLHR